MPETDDYSSLSYEETEAEVLRTAAYERLESSDLAFRHAEACDALAVKRPNTAVKGSNTVGYSPETLARMAKDARAFARSTAAAEGGGSMFVRGSFSSVRDHG